MADWQRELETAQTACSIGRKILLEYFGKLSQVEDKGEGAGLVSEADKESERAIREYLLKEFPEYGVLGEEEGYGSRKPLSSEKGLWIIDPLDGTTNYVHQFPVFCISIGLEVNGEIVVGVVDAPMMNQTFTAVKSQGAFLNGKKISVSKTNAFNEAFLATGFSYKRGPNFKIQMEIFHSIYSTCRGIRRAGAAAYDLALVAAGVFDGFWEKGLKPWDLAAGSLLVREAGGMITSYDSSSFHPRQDTVIAATPAIHPKILDEIRKHI